MDANHEVLQARHPKVKGIKEQPMTTPQPSAAKGYKATQQAPKDTAEHLFGPRKDRDVTFMMECHEWQRNTEDMRQTARRIRT